MSGQKGKDGSKKRKVKRHLHETRQMAVIAISMKILKYFTVSVSDCSNTITFATPKDRQTDQYL